MSRDRQVERILEVGGYAAGYAGRLFVHGGADVVRLSGQEDPAWASPEAMQAYLHADKRQIAIHDPSLLSELAQQADVVIVHAENAAAAAATGVLDWEGTVRVVLTGFGLTGPKCNWRATPNVLLAMGGYTALMGDADREPLSLPGHYLEFQAGALGYMAANAARWAGKDDCLIDISLLETALSLSQFTTVRWHCAGEVRGRHGSDFWFVEPSELYECQDGWVYINIVPQFWDPFTVLIDRPDLALDERFANNDLRMENRAVLHEYVRAAVSQLTCAELNERAHTCRVPMGVVTSLSEVLDEAHLAERGFWYNVTVGGETVRVPGTSFRLNHAPFADRQVKPPRVDMVGEGLAQGAWS